MSNTQATYFIKDEFFGTSLIELPATTPAGIIPHSFAYFCGTCGEVWARIIANPSAWEVRQVPCELHRPSSVQDWSATPGSILTAFIHKNMTAVTGWAAALELLPPEIIQREFNLHLTRFEKSL